MTERYGEVQLWGIWYDIATTTELKLEYTERLCYGSIPKEI